MNNNSDTTEYFVPLAERFRISCKNYLDKIVVKLNANEPDHFYHYTNGDGLFGILKNHTIWLTDIFSLNDPSELKYGVELAYDHLFKKTEFIPHLTKFTDLFRKIIKDNITINLKNTATYHIACFSNAGDDLGQWRAYADNGRGYAILFDRSIFLDKWPAEGRHNSFGGCPR